MTFLLLGLTLITASCVEDSARAGRPLIKDFTIQVPDSGPCTGFLITSETLDAQGEVTEDSKCINFVDACVTRCPDGRHSAEQDEFEELLKVDESECPDFSTRSNDGETLRDQFGAFGEEVSGVCIQDKPEIKRPTKQIFINKDFCACFKGKSDLVNTDCANFCASQPSSDIAMLFGSVTLGPEVELNAGLGSLGAFCGSEIGDGLSAPACSLQVSDGTSTTNLPLETIAVGSNSFKAIITGLPLDTSFVAKIVETGSGSLAETSSFQLRRATPSEPTTSIGPLRIMPISLYTCITKSGSVLNGDFLASQFQRMHFYFAANSKPESMPPNTLNMVCHDAQLAQDSNDSPLRPRLELIPTAFSMWDISDMRFFDQSDGAGGLPNQKLDINDIIEKRLLKEFRIARTINLFADFSWPNRPPVSGLTSSNIARLGFFMQPFINQQTGRGLCPTQVNYNSTDPVFKILKDLVGVDTEGVFLALREPKVLVDPTTGQSSPSIIDILMIREGLLKKIWFYFENGLHFEPNEITSTQKTIHFYWPPDPVNPYVKKPNQEIYTIRTAQDVNQPGIRTNLTPPDKRFACIPALE